MLWAITDTSYRAITNEHDLAEGERAATHIPQTVVDAGLAAMRRAERNALLRGSDWTQAIDSPLTAAMKEAWAVYRTKLRAMPDLPEWPYIEWPEEPEAGTSDKTN